MTQRLLLRLPPAETPLLLLLQLQVSLSLDSSSVPVCRALPYKEMWTSHELFRTAYPVMVRLQNLVMMP